MDVQIRFASSHLSEVDRHNLEATLVDTLARLRPHVTQVLLYLEDSNGPRGGVDKQCRCVLHLRRMPPVVVRDKDESWFNLINRVANRAAFALSNKLDRKSKMKTRRLPRAKEQVLLEGVETQSNPLNSHPLN